MPALDLETIRRRLADYRPEILPADRGHAAVAMLLREQQARTELLFIVRARHDEDPWSGDIGFPGGRLQRGERHSRQAAERETYEELGLDLQKAEHLGRLDDLYGATLPILVSCFVYHLAGDQPLRPNHEIARGFWVDLPRLLDPERHLMASFAYRGRQLTHPAVDLLGPGRTVLWGITYRLIQNFFRTMGLPFGPGQKPMDV